MDYSIGIVVGRFQPFTNGHKHMVDKALSIADRVAVLVGSADSPRNDANPFSFVERKEMIEGSFGKDERDRMVILPLVDKHLGDCPEWGEFIHRNLSMFVDGFDNAIKSDKAIFVSGKEIGRLKWEMGCDLLLIDRMSGISGTNVRKMIADDDASLFSFLPFPKEMADGDLSGGFDFIKKEGR